MTNYSNKEHFPITETTAYRQVLELLEEGRVKSRDYLALLRLEVVSDLKRKFSLLEQQGGSNLSWRKVEEAWLMTGRVRRRRRPYNHQ